MERLKRIVRAPAWYMSWSVFVLFALVATYYTEPNVFGFTTLILAWVSGVVVVVGMLGVIVWWGFSTPAQKAAIVLSLVVVVVAIVVAFRTLAGFKWA